MLSGAKEKHRLWSIKDGWGTVVRRLYRGDCGDIKVEFDNYAQGTFSTDGKEYFDDENPILFWDEISITPPVGPRMDSVAEKYLELMSFEYIEGNKNYFILYDKGKFIVCEAKKRIIGIEYHARKELDEFVKFLNENNVDPYSVDEIIRRHEISIVKYREYQRNLPECD